MALNAQILGALMQSKVQSKVGGMTASESSSADITRLTYLGIAEAIIEHLQMMGEIQINCPPMASPTTPEASTGASFSSTGHTHSQSVLNKIL